MNAFENIQNIFVLISYELFLGHADLFDVLQKVVQFLASLGQCHRFSIAQKKVQKEIVDSKHSLHGAHESLTALKLNMDALVERFEIDLRYQLLRISMKHPSKDEHSYQQPTRELIASHRQSCRLYTFALQEENDQDHE